MANAAIKVFILALSLSQVFSEVKLRRQKLPIIYRITASILLKDGSNHKFVGKIASCNAPNAGSLCLTLGKETRSERLLRLRPSQWDNALRTDRDMQIELVGRVEGDEIIVRQLPRVFRETTRHLLNPPSPALPVDRHDE